MLNIQITGGKESNIEVEYYMISDFDTSTVGNKNFKISYNGLSVIVSYIVIDDRPDFDSSSFYYTSSRGSYDYFKFVKSLNSYYVYIAEYVDIKPSNQMINFDFYFQNNGYTLSMERNDSGDYIVYTCTNGEVEWTFTIYSSNITVFMERSSVTSFFTVYKFNG